MRNKAIALLVFRNEERFLPTYLSSIKGTVEALVALDNGSTDSSRNILKAFDGFPVFIEDYPTDLVWNVDKARQRLLEKGREVGKEMGINTFLCLDADEAVTAPFKQSCSKVYGALQPGQRVLMQWLAMWKSVDHYRDDSSVWSRNYKDFIFRDSPQLSHKLSYLCESRTPVTDEATQLTLNTRYGAVMHFQFSDWDRFQLKQFWYRVQERLAGKNPPEISPKYSITLDDEAAIITPLDKNWTDGIVMPNIDYKPPTVESCWHIRDLKRIINEKGKGILDGLDRERVVDKMLGLV